MTLSITQAAGALGAHIDGIDLRDDLSAQTVAQIRQALLDHLVIFFRNQQIDENDHIRFARYFGEIVQYPMANPLENYPQIVPVIKLEHERVNFGGLWHSDTTYLDQPPMGSILVARELPPVGGDTLFANMYAAFESLSDGLKDTLLKLKAVNNSEGAASTRINTGGKPAPIREAIHPVVRTHPETGRHALYINSGHTVRFDGMTESESRPLIDHLLAHLIRPEFTCRFQWQPGSIVFWDNRSCQHNPVNDYHGYRRVMHRVTLTGDRPV